MSDYERSKRRLEFVERAVAYAAILLGIGVVILGFKHIYVVIQEEEAREIETAEWIEKQKEKEAEKEAELAIKNRPFLVHVGDSTAVSFVKSYNKNNPNAWYEVGHFDEDGKLQWTLFNEGGDSNREMTVKKIEDYQGSLQTDDHIIIREKDKYKKEDGLVMHQYTLYLNKKGFEPSQYIE